MEDIIKVIAGCRVVTVQKTVEVPQFLFSLAIRTRWLTCPLLCTLVFWSRQCSPGIPQLQFLDKVDDTRCCTRQVLEVLQVQFIDGYGRRCDHAAMGS